MPQRYNTALQLTSEILHSLYFMRSQLNANVLRQKFHLQEIGVRHDY